MILGTVYKSNLVSSHFQINVALSGFPYLREGFCLTSLISNISHHGIISHPVMKNSEDMNYADTYEKK